MSRAYLVVSLDAKTLSATGVRVFSLPPWTTTRMFGPKAPVMAVVLEAPGASYDEARSLLLSMYPDYEPALAKRFPPETLR